MKIDIPPKALEALARELGYVQHKSLYEAAILAALNAWPGMREIISVQLNMAPAIILPLPQESAE